MIIKAKFIGRDSLSYNNGETYTLLLEIFYGALHGLAITKIEEWGSIDPLSYCPYDNIEAFFNNWTNIKTNL